MSLTTLPYPNIDFVPLDVLTADQLDQLVANINAINAVTIPASPYIATGTATFTAQAETTTAQAVTIPTQADTAYRVFIQPLEANSAIQAVATDKTTAGFNISVTNSGDAATVSFDYLVIK